MSRGIAFLLGGVVLLAGAAGLALAAGSSRPDRAATNGREFQALVGGLGFGPATDLSRCGAAFDPRIEGACSWRLEPLPAARGVCVLHPGLLLAR